jgi:SWI/SNF-related matrix-associated actin-dependent regulator 1 of chromatin subfamily A
MHTTHTVRIDTLGADAAVSPIAYLGSEAFDAYREACRSVGARWDRAARANRAPLEVVDRLRCALEARGFAVETTTALADALAARASETRADVASAEQRAESVDNALRERGSQLYPFQRAGVAWLAARSAALLADEMGTGKTIQALAALPFGAPVLVVCPAVAKGVWQREAAKWRPDLSVSVLSGRQSFRWPAPNEMVVVNYDILAEDAGGAPARCVVIADEAHAIKSAKAQRTKRFRALARAARAVSGKVMLLTATPLTSRPTDLWSVLAAAGLDAEAFGSWPAFVRAFSGRKGRWGGYEWGSPKPEAADALSRVMLRRLRKDVLRELPPKTWEDLAVEIDRATRKDCDALVAELAAIGVDIVGATDEAAMTRARTVAFARMSEVRAALATAKIPALLEIVSELEDAGEPVVVFSAHRAPIDHLGARDGWATITGDTPAATRTEIEASFQRGSLRGVAATIQAGGVAITLTSAHRAVFVDQDWTPALNAQAEDRICRIGQDRGVIITRLVAEHALDQRIAEVLSAKTAIIEGSVDAAAATSAPLADAAQSLETAAVTARAHVARKSDTDDALEHRALRDQETSATTLELVQRAAARARASEFVRKLAELHGRWSARQSEWARVIAKEQREREQQRAEAHERDKRDGETIAAQGRPPRDDAERYAAAALAYLVAEDPDWARERNDRGFAASDSRRGRVLAHGATSGALCDSDWREAIALARKYSRQVKGALG